MPLDYSSLLPKEIFKELFRLLKSKFRSPSHFLGVEEKLLWSIRGWGVVNCGNFGEGSGVRDFP